MTPPDISADDASIRRYAERIDRVRQHIHTHLDAPLDLDTLADVACLSRFHWHRIYRGITGETVAQTVRRLRLARAAQDLAGTMEPVSAISERAGYTTQAAFTRAFAAIYGQPPADFRRTGQHAALIQARQEENAMAFPVGIRTLPARPALGLAHSGPYHDIGRTFGQLDLILRSHGLLPCVRGMFGLYVDDPDTVPPEQLRSHACVYVESADARSPKLVSLTVGGGAYAVLTYKGPYAAMKPAYDWLFGTWLPQAGREPRDAPVMEINLNTPMETAPQDLLTEICLPLET